MRRGRGVKARGDSDVCELSRFATYSDTRCAVRRLSDMQIVPGLLSQRRKKNEGEIENEPTSSSAILAALINSTRPMLAQTESAESSLLESLRLPANTEYELVTPYEVDHHGNYVSHAIAHHHRRKRSMDGDGIDPVSVAHFRLRGLGRNFHMELRPSMGLISPGFTVQTLEVNGVKKLETFPGEDFCFYQGSLRSEVNSAVALSTCTGMVHNENFTAAPEHHPHILYRIHKHTPERRGGVKTRHRRHGYSDDRRTRQKQHYCGRRKKYMPQPPPEDAYVASDEYKAAPRERRAVTPGANPRLNVETLVVVDQNMMENHGRENVTTFVLTVLNMVSTLFKDRTIGGDINVVIVGLILLNGEQDGLVINHHADHTLSSFCQWQSALAGREGRRHDHAILLTGLDICSWKNEPCDTLGFAPISGMCSKYRSCTVNEDTGLGLAFTIAHESGHNFGMIHDGEGNVCKKSTGNIMSPTLAGDNGLFSWSSCSRQYLTRFLRTSVRLCGVIVLDENARPNSCRQPRDPAAALRCHVNSASVCDGVSREYKLCNTFACPVGAADFRAVQCAEFNAKPFRGLYYRWKPYTHFKDNEVCKLYCFAEGYDFFYALSNKVRDGTRCTLDSTSVCVDGVCEKAGCDQKLGSTAVLDKCGVCNGKNSTCKIYKGRYTKQHYSNQYYGVVTIPQGARSIHVVETNSSRSFLALRNTHRKYYLNGHWKVDWPGRYSIAGSVFDYKRPYNGLESLTSTGPTSETLVVEILLQGWNPGEMRTKAVCYKDQRVHVNTSFCNPKIRPKAGTVSCNTQPCPPRVPQKDLPSLTSRTQCEELGHTHILILACVCRDAMAFCVGV
ncbi:A disintegrin and metalloproteinase with thrombospondin motifs 16 [Bagarius yarrelli]|uniref:A disintegrin and metalloproteinase with thrombospondin motifs 16 n=1 Tax=Bagarius yarrelli TaxID=175774 RepID=A0A556U1L7_BAGYA|nr:A disintegrin and metalloproteinase with thrombospondin motifs 16 [Bagarius yarrelli]